MHDTQQLQECGEKDDYIKHTFLGVFPADQIPAHLPAPSCLIANTDPAHEPGQHWVALIVRDGGQKIFFDSYGLEPTYYNPRLWKNLTSWEKSTQDFQQRTTSVCGDWCLYTLRAMTRNPRLQLHTLLKHFDPQDPMHNDRVIFDAIHSLYPKILNAVSHPRVSETQCCKSRE